MEAGGAAAAAAPAEAMSVAPADQNQGPAEAKAAWSFPVFVGHRRRLPPDAVLFEAGNIEREALAKQAAVDVARDERRQLATEAELAADAELADRLATTFQCGQCHACLPTSRLLDIHLSEMHDSFFAAQAARRMPVYLCLVEGCHRKFCTLEERKQHLHDHHLFPKNYAFERIHLRRRKSQIRPLPQHRKGHNRLAMATDQDGGAKAAHGSSAAAASKGDKSTSIGGQPAPSDQVVAGAEPAAQQGEGLQAQQKERAPVAAEVAAAAAAADDVTHSMSRLSMAAETSRVPNVVSFGRGRGRGLAGVSRGRGGQKAHAHFMED